MNRPRTWIFAALLFGLTALVVVAKVTGYSGMGLSAPAASQPVGPGWEQANPLRPLPTVPLGLDRSFTELYDPPTPERVRLGRWLFFDKRLSADGTISCASCHQSAAGFSATDSVATGVGGKRGTRKPPPILNLAFTIRQHQFWDGRSTSLEEQAMAPVTNPIEMGNTHDGMIRSISGISGYSTYFGKAFGDERITTQRVARALADYERTRLSGNSPWDRWQAGDASAVDAKVKAGHDLFFFGKAACNRCHFGPTFSDSSFHNLGIGFDATKGIFADAGRGSVSKVAADAGAFKTPMLRDVARRAPYFHDGSVQTLREVVEWYNAGGRTNPQLDPVIQPLRLSATEVDSLVAFLESLNGEGFQDDGPAEFPH